MKLEGLIPIINVRFIAIDGTTRKGGHTRTILDCDDRKQRERLFLFAQWEIIGIQASVRHKKGDLWPTLVIILQQDSNGRPGSTDEPCPGCAEGFATQPPDHARARRI